MIAAREIEEVIRDLLDEDPWQLIVPGQVYHAMNKRGRCCGCFPNAIDVIVEVTEAYHRELMTPDAEVISIVEKLRAEHARQEKQRIKVRQQRRTASAA